MFDNLIIPLKTYQERNIKDKRTSNDLLSKPIKKNDVIVLKLRFIDGKTTQSC